MWIVQNILYALRAAYKRVYLVVFCDVYYRYSVHDIRTQNVFAVSICIPRTANINIIHIYIVNALTPRVHERFNTESPYTLAAAHLL